MITIIPNQGIAVSLAHFTPISLPNTGRRLVDQDLQNLIRTMDQNANGFGMQRVLPQAKLTEINGQRCILFSLFDEDGELLSRSQEITSNIPRNLEQDLYARMQSLYDLAQGENVQPEFRWAVDVFQLLQPSQYPALYRLVNGATGKRLLVLWGIRAHNSQYIPMPPRVNVSASAFPLPGKRTLLAAAILLLFGGVMAKFGDQISMPNFSTPSTEKETPPAAEKDSPGIRNFISNTTPKGEMTISGMTTPESQIVLKNPANEVIATGKSDQMGKFVIPIAENKLSMGEAVQIDVIDPAEQVSTGTVTLTPSVRDLTLQVTPDNDAIMTGITDPQNDVALKNAVGEVIGRGKADNHGQFTITVPRNKLHSGEEIWQLLITTPNGTKGTHDIPVNIQIPPVIYPATTTNDGKMIVNGKTEPGNKVTLQDDQGEILGIGKADDDGKFALPIEKDKLPTKGDLLLSVTGKDGKTQNSVLPLLPQVSDLHADTQKNKIVIAGKTDPNSDVQLEDERGKIINRGKADRNGKFSLPVPQQKLPLPEQKLRLKVTSLTGKESENEISIQPAARLRPPENDQNRQNIRDLSADQNAKGEITINGVTTPNSDVRLKDQRGKTLSTGKADDNGQFTLPVPAKKLPPANQNLRLQVITPENEKSEREISLQNQVISPHQLRGDNPISDIRPPNQNVTLQQYPKKETTGDQTTGNLSPENQTTDKIDSQAAAESPVPPAAERVQVENIAAEDGQIKYATNVQTTVVTKKVIQDGQFFVYQITLKAVSPLPNLQDATWFLGDKNLGTGTEKTLTLKKQKDPYRVLVKFPDQSGKYIYLGFSDDVKVEDVQNVSNY